MSAVVHVTYAYCSLGVSFNFDLIQFQGVLIIFAAHYFDHVSFNLITAESPTERGNRAFSHLHVIPVKLDFTVFIIVCQALIYFHCLNLVHPTNRGAPPRRVFHVSTAGR